MEEPDNPESMKNNITEGEGRPFLLKGKEKQNKEEKKEKDKKKNRKREKRGKTVTVPFFVVRQSSK